MLNASAPHVNLLTLYSEGEEGNFHIFVKMFSFTRPHSARFVQQRSTMLNRHAPLLRRKFRLQGLRKRDEASVERVPKARVQFFAIHRAAALTLSHCTAPERLVI